MELKRIFVAIFFVGFLSSAKAEMIKPAENLSAYDVIKIQLEALKNNDDNDTGIKQTWLFAHPENKKYTGPLGRFVSMIRSNPYDVLLGSLFFETKLISKNQTEAKVEVFLDGKNKNRYQILWILSKSNISEECTNCWMTIGVSQPQNLGPII